MVEIANCAVVSSMWMPYSCVGRACRTQSQTQNLRSRWKDVRQGGILRMGSSLQRQVELVYSERKMSASRLQTRRLGFHSDVRRIRKSHERDAHGRFSLQIYLDWTEDGSIGR